MTGPSHSVSKSNAAYGKESLVENTAMYAVITYLLVFRLAIIVIGGISIGLGYLLFVKGIFPSGDGGEGGALHAKLAGHEFSLSNAAPGTFFAVFGALVIAVMILSAPPEYIVSPGSGSQPSMTIRGEQEVQSDDIWHQKAWTYLDHALDAVHKAVGLTPGNQDYLDTLAAITFVGAEDEEARNKALARAPDKGFQQRLQQYCQAEKP